MAGSMKDIKLRIKSVESTMQITKAMRVLKKGGVFALNDEMKPHMYGDM